MIQWGSAEVKMKGGRWVFSPRSRKAKESLMAGNRKTVPGRKSWRLIRRQFTDESGWRTHHPDQQHRISAHLVTVQTRTYIKRNDVVPTSFLLSANTEGAASVSSAATSHRHQKCLYIKLDDTRVTASWAPPCGCFQYIILICYFRLDFWQIKVSKCCSN